MVNFVKVATFFLGFAALCSTSLAVRKSLSTTTVDQLGSYQCPEHDYTTSIRARCDTLLAEILKPLYDEQNPAPSLYVSLDDTRFQVAWRCYAADPCFMVPPGPGKVSLDFIDGRKWPKMRVGMDGDVVEITLRRKRKGWWRQQANNFVWHSYQEWQDAMRDAVYQVLRRAAENDIDDVYVAVNVGSPGAGVAGDEDEKFNQSLADKHEKLMFKSELWSLIHVLPVLESYGARGVFWLQESSPIAARDGAKLSGESALVIPFDASHSGLQAGTTIALALDQTIDTSVKVYAPVGMARSKEFIESEVESAFEEVLDGEKITSRSEVFVGHEVKDKLFATQFKVPDFFSVPYELALLLQCALCCAGKDVKREPYKFFTKRRISRNSCSVFTPPAQDVRCGDPPSQGIEECMSFECKCPWRFGLPFGLPSPF